NKSLEVDSQRIDSFDMELDGLPARAPDKADSVIEIRCDGDIQTDTNRLLQPQFPADILRAFDCVPHGVLRYGPGGISGDYVTDWTSPGDSVSWPVRLIEPARYEVLINYVATEDSAGGSFVVSLGPRTLHGRVKAGNPRIESLGAVSLEPGPFEITVSAGQIAGHELFRLRGLELRSL
ncbi:MAG: hypothetical protein ACREE6_15085, partial [Limisphaerales bacterium]